MSLDSKLHDAQSMRSKTRTLDCWLERIFVQFQECKMANKKGDTGQFYSVLP